MDIIESVKKQESFIKNPTSIIKFFDNINIADDLLIKEMNEFQSGFSHMQSGILRDNMQGKLMTPRNFIMKILSDFMISPTDFNTSYKPGDNTPIVNYLLKKKVEVIEKDGKYIKHYISEHEDDILPFIIKMYPYIGHNDVKMSYYFKNKNFVNMAISSYFGQLNKFPKLDFELNKNNYKDLLAILNNPSIQTTSQGQPFYLDSTQPDSNIYGYQRDSEKFIKIYFPTNNK